MKNCLKKSPLAIIFLLILPTFSLAAQFKVTKVYDGDTIAIQYHCKTEKVRLLYVNTPESFHSDEKQNVPMGKVASDYTKNRLQGKYVELEFEGPPRDNAGRLLAYVLVDGVYFNLELVGKGLSPYYTKYGLSQEYNKAFREAEKHARDQKLNIWGDPELAKKYMELKSIWDQYRSQNASPIPKAYTILTKTIWLLLSTVLGTLVGLVVAFFKLRNERRKNTNLLLRLLVKPLKKRVDLLVEFIGNCRDQSPRAYTSGTENSSKFMRFLADIKRLLNDVGSTYGSSFADTISERYGITLEVKGTVDELEPFAKDEGIAWAFKEEPEYKGLDAVISKLQSQINTLSSVSGSTV